MTDTQHESRVDAVRRFNRFYTQRIGVLEEGYASGPFSLAQARVLYEVKRRGNPTATELARDLALDAGYLSRILRGFEVRGLVVRETADHDGRQNLISMTARGRREFAPIEGQSQAAVGAMLQALPGDGQARLVTAMATIERLLAPGPTSGTPYLLRPPRAGDMGWVVSRHGSLYAQEYGWDATIEALVAEIVAQFIRSNDPTCERCWIAERDGENIGSIFVVKDSAEVARLRLLLVDPQARGLGLGKRLVEECIGFARHIGYHKLTLWTHRALVAARHIYQAAGFELVREWTHDDFGRPLISETWDLTL